MIYFRNKVFPIASFLLFLSFLLLSNVGVSIVHSKDTTAEETPIQKKIKKLTQEQQLFEKKLQKELQKLQAEQKRLEKRYELIMQEHQNELANLEKKQSKLDAELSVEDKQHKKKLSEAKQKIEELQTRMQLSQTRSDSALQVLREQKKRLSTEMELEELQKKDELSELTMKSREVELKQKIQQAKSSMAEARLTRKKLKQQMKLSEIKTKKARMEAELALGNIRSQRKKRVVDPVTYKTEPRVDGTLYITDRRINLNGPILSKTGAWVADRLHYFNNVSEEKPIFIVIEDSPGGSVMAGFRIIKTMKSIAAPVYVVVKERAMSMAAGITAQADRSFTFPDALILHHEIQSSMGGSLTETEEGLELMKKVWRRVASPVAERMDMTLKEFRERLYEENSNGNWREFGNEAVELNWADHIITKIEDASVREEPQSSPPTPTIFFLEKDHKNIKRDSEGNYYRILPPLRPHDFYFMYDPDNYYRW